MKKLILTTLAALLCFASAACGAGGSAAGEQTLDIQITAGEENVLEDGTYSAIVIDASMSGTEDSPTVIRAADGAHPVIKADPGAFQSGEKDELPQNCGIRMVNVHDILIEGLTVEGGTHGIIYESTAEQGDIALGNVTIRDCKVSGVVGAHGICVYARNDLAPVQDLTVQGCEVSDCLCGDSESLVLNGNIDGFTIADNNIHDNNNIGIDMIGFEGTAEHMEIGNHAEAFSADMVRNGKCFGNTVYNISTDRNPAYAVDGEYDLCAGGIYVDGGQEIEIYNNHVYNCDIGIEVATEHSPDDAPLFNVSGISVHDNVISDCRGWCGLCFGGCDGNKGFTEECEFFNNTLTDNAVQICVQRSRSNRIHNNIIAGGDLGIVFSGDCKEEDMVNSFGSNIWCFEDAGLDEMIDADGRDPGVLIPEDDMDRQEVLRERNQALDGVRSKIPGFGAEVNDRM